MIAAFAAMAAMAVVAGAGTGGGSPVALLLVAILAGLGASLAVGLAAERIALRPLRSAPRIKPLIASLGVSIVLQNAIMLLAGPQPRAFTLPFPVPAWTVLGANVSLLEVGMLAAVLVCAVMLQLYLGRSRQGLAIRAIAQSVMGARLMGIRIDSTVRSAFAISSATAALAGLFMASYYGLVKFNMGFVPGIKGFAIAILGGVGNVGGAVLAGFFVGIAEVFFAGYISSDYRDLFVFALLVATLVLRPQGILGRGR
jgi:branched-chain amino acid transport system permease protein